MHNEDVISHLNTLIETSKDGEYGFQTSAESLRNPELKRLFMSRALECREAASELQALVRQLGGEPDDSGTLAGAMHRGWVAVRTTLASYSDKVILEEAERGEDSALARYRKVAEEEDLPMNVRIIVERQLAGVKENHAQIRSLRDQARATA